MRVQSRVLAIAALAALVAMSWATPLAVADHALPGEATAFYFPKTGELQVHANGVARVSVFSAGANLADAASGLVGNFLVATVDNPNASDLTWIALSNTIGGVPGFESEGGNIVKAGTPASDLTLVYQLVGGAPEGNEGTIVVIPEPASLALLALAGLGLVAYRRRAA